MINDIFIHHSNSLKNPIDLLLLFTTCFVLATKHRHVLKRERNIKKVDKPLKLCGTGELFLELQPKNCFETDIRDFIHQIKKKNVALFLSIRVMNVTATSLKSR